MLTCITMIKQRQEAAISGGRSHSYSVRSISAEATIRPWCHPLPSPRYQELYFMFEFTRTAVRILQLL